MASPPVLALSAHVSWLDVLPLLGVETESLALPATVLCPCCTHVSLTVFHDLMCGGQWYACTACQFAGDSLELTAAARQLSHGDSFAYLQAEIRGLEHLDSDVSVSERDHENYAGRRAQIRDFWYASQRPGPIHDTDRGEALLKRFGLNDRCRSERWRHRGGQLIGFSAKEDFEALILPQTLLRRQEHGRRTAGASFFKGRGWGPLLVVPCWDMPGRIHGFWLIGRDGGPGDRKYRQIATPLSSIAASRHTAGVAFLPAALAQPEGATILAHPDFDRALKLHLDHLDDHSTFLPIVTGFTDPRATTGICWQAVGRRTLVHFGDRVQPSLYRHAADAGSPCVTIANHEHELAPMSLVNQVLSATPVTWETALERQLRVTAAVDRAGFLRTVNLPDLVRHRFTVGCDPTLRTQLRAIDAEFPTGRKVTLGAWQVHETRRGWVSVNRAFNTEAPVSDMRLRIDQVVWQPQQTCAIYRGRILYHEHEIPFSLPTRVFDKDPFGAMRDIVVARGLGAPKFDPWWSKRAVMVAQHFEPTESRVGFDSVGWHPDVGFVFPEYVQRADGLVEDLATYLRYTDPVPCCQFTRPQGLSESFQATLSNGSQRSAILLAVAAYVVSRALHPTHVEHLALTGAEASQAGQAAALACGCIELTVQAVIKQPIRRILRDLNVAAAANRWPTIIKPAWELEKRRHLQVLQGLRSPSIAAVPIVSGLALRIRHPWIELRCTVAPTNQIMPAAAGTIIPNYLEDFCVRGMPLRDGATVEQVLDDMVLWLGPSAAKTVKAAKLLLTLDTPFNRAAAFAELVHRCYLAGEFRETLRGELKEPSSDLNLVLLENGRVFVPVRGLNLILRRYGVSLELEEIEAALDAADVRCSVLSYQGRPGWVIPEKWWQMQKTSEMTAFNARTRLNRPGD